MSFGVCSDTELIKNCVFFQTGSDWFECKLHIDPKLFIVILFQGNHLNGFLILLYLHIDRNYWKKTLKQNIYSAIEKSVRFLILTNMYLKLNKVAFSWPKVWLKTVIMWTINTILNNFFLCGFFMSKCDVFLRGKAEFSAAIALVFNVTWSFRNHSKKLIWCSRNISYYFQSVEVENSCFLWKLWCISFRFL